VVYRTWRFFMSFSAVDFEKGQISADQSLPAKPEQGQVSLPMAGADLYL
jgi:hypothetical protein